jgi:hypothetical protein
MALSRVQGALSSGRVQGRAAVAAAAVQERGGRASIQERARARLQARMHAEGRDAGPPSSSHQRNSGRSPVREGTRDAGASGSSGSRSRGIRGARAVAARAAVTAKGGRAEVQRRARQRLDCSGERHSNNTLPKPCTLFLTAG